MSNRLSIHVDPDNQSNGNKLEAFTITSPSGYLGITTIPTSGNTGLSSLLPDAPVNIQGSGGGPQGAVLRVSNGYLDRYDSTDSRYEWNDLPYAQRRAKIELCGIGNTPDNGITIMRGGGNDFSISRPHIDHSANKIPNHFVSFFDYDQSSRMVTIGDARIYNEQETYKNLSSANEAVLAISRSGDPSLSGTVALREQLQAPSATANFGKIYVRPYTPSASSQTQSLFFTDDAGNEYNLTQSDEDSAGGHIYGNQYGNTFGGWYTPRLRWSHSSISNNTYYGYGIDRIAGSNSTMIGFHTGSGTNGDKNTIIGAESFQKWSNSDNNIIVGYKNLTAPTEENPTDRADDLIIIGNELFSSDVPDRYTLAIGVESTPFVTGIMKGPNRDFTIISSDSEDTRFKLRKSFFDYNLGVGYVDGRHTVTFGSQDFSSSLQSRSMLSMVFKNKDGGSQTLMDYDPSGTMGVTPTWGSPTYKRPTVSVSGDLRVLGDVRFSDGTSLSSTSSFLQNIPLPNSGLKRTLIDNNYYWGLEFDNVPLAESQVEDVNPSQSYVITDLNSSHGVGKMSLTALGAYITSGTATFGEKCNAVFTNPDNFSSISTSLNSNSVFIGCDVATNATGWKHGIFIGTEAGLDSTTTNGGLSSDTACIYMGLQAGHSASNTDNSIFIGNGAGKNADSSIRSIFIGAGAGQNSTNANSVGIGSHALEGELSESEGGQRNIEIIAGLDDNQRLFWTSGVLSETLNIQNAIAGNLKTPSISIGRAILTPSAPLEVRRDTADTNYSLGHTDANIQKWINNGEGAARVNSSGHYIETTVSTSHDSEQGQTVESWYGTHEGFMEDYIYAPSSFTSPNSGWMTTRSYENGFAADRKILVINRDTKQDIHGPGAVGGTAYVITMTVNGEHRPVYVSCSGSS